MKGFLPPQTHYELAIYELTRDPLFYDTINAPKDAAKLSTIPFTVAWQGSLKKTDRRARDIATSLWGILHVREQELVDAVTEAIGSIDAIVDLTHELPKDISGKLIRLKGATQQPQALLSFSTQAVTDFMKVTEVAPSVQRLAS